MELSAMRPGTVPARSRRNTGGVPAAAPCARQTVDEYQLKAAFLSKLAKFVEWPRHTSAAPGPDSDLYPGRGPIRRCAATGREWEDDRRAGNLPYVSISDVRQASGCSILFISSSERKRLRAILAEIKTNGILTVGDTGNFAVEGGVINLKLEGGRVRLQINLDAADRQKLRISAKLLSLAQIVKN